MGEIKFKSIYILLFLMMIYQLMSTSASAQSSTYPNLTAESAVLMDAKTGQVLFAKNLHDKQYPASITKIMTGMVALEKGNLADRITMSREAVFSIGRNSSHIALDADEELTLEQALYANAIASANDASNGIAEHISGSLEDFAQLMNKIAGQLGAMNTNFVNAHGLPDEDHYTTAYDMAKIMMEALKNPKFTEIFGEARYQIPPTNKQEETRYLRSKHPLINGNNQYEGIIAGKGGWTSQANHTLITAAKQGDRKLIVVVMNNQSAKNNQEDTIKLFDYGFQDFVDYKIDVADLKTIIGELPGLPELFLNNAAYVKFKSEAKMLRLLHHNVSVNNLETSYAVLKSNDDESLQVILSLNLKQPNNFMYEDLGSVLIEASIIKEHLPAEITANVDSGNNKLYVIVSSAGIVLLCFFRIVVLVKRNYRKRNYVNLSNRYRY